MQDAKKILKRAYIFQKFVCFKEGRLEYDAKVNSAAFVKIILNYPKLLL